MSSPRARRPRRRRGRLLLAALASLLLLAVTRPLIERHIERSVVEALSAALGDEVSLDATRFEVLSLSLELEGLRVTREGRVIAGLELGRLSLSHAALLRGRLRVEQLELHAPFARLGQGGLETLAGEASGDSVAAPIEIEVEALHVRKGALSWSSGDRTFALESVELHSAQLWRRTSGSLELSATVGAAGDFDPLVAGAQLATRLVFGPGGVRVEELTLQRGDALDASVRGSLELPDGARPLTWRGELAVGVGGDALVGLVPRLGEFLRAGQVDILCSGQGSASDWSATVTLATPELLALAPTGESLALRDLSLRASASAAGLVLESLDTSVAGGRLSAEASLPLSGSESVLNLRVRLAGLRAGELPRAETWASVPGSEGALLDGELSGTIPLDALTTSVGTVDLHLRVPEDERAAAPQLDLSASADAQGWTLSEAVFESATLSARASGTLGWDGRSALDLRLDATSLAELVHVFALSPQLDDLDLDGALRLEGRVTGTPAEPRFDARVVIEPLSLRRQPLGRVAVTLEATREALTLDDGTLTGADLEVHFVGAVPLATPSGATATLDLRRLDLALLGRVLGRTEEAAGLFTGKLSVEPGAGEARIVAELQAESARFASVEASDLRLSASLSGGTMIVEEASARLAGGQLRVAGSVELAGDDLLLEIDAEGLDLERLPVDLEALLGTSVAGRASVALQLGGTLEAPLPIGPARWSVVELVVSGRELGPVEGELSPDGADFLMRARGLDGGLRASGRIGGGGARAVDLRLELDALEASFETEPLGSLAVDAQGLTLDVEGELSAPGGLRHRLSGDSVRVQAQGRVLRTAAGLKLTGIGATLQVQDLALLLDEHALSLDATLDLADPARHRVRMRGSLDLQSLEALMPQLLVDGEALLDLTSVGDGEALDLTGTLSITKSQLKVKGYPQSLEDLSLEAAWEPGRLVLRELRATLGGGLVQGSGEVELEGWTPGHHRVRLQGEDVGLRPIEGFSSTASFELVLDGHAEASLLSGSIEVQEARYLRDVRLEASLASPGRTPPSSTLPGPLDRVRLDLEVNAGSGVFVDNDLAAVELAGRFDVVGTASHPLLSGEAHSVGDGRLSFQRASYRLTDASTVFTLAHPNDPELSALAQTRLADHDIELRLSGRLSDPRVELSSSPDLPQERIVALVASGGAMGAGSGDAVPADLAVDYLHGRLGPVTDALKRFTGVDILELDPSLDGGQDDHVARLTVGKKLSPRVTAIVSTDLGGASASSASLSYQATEQLALRAAREATGANAISATWKRRPRRPPGDLAEKDPTDFLLGELNLGGLPEGLDDQAARTLLALSSGDQANPRELRRAASRLRSALHERGHALARVTCDPVVPLGNGLDEAVAVACEATAGPELVLVLEGPLGKRLRRRLEEAVQTQWRELFRAKDLSSQAVATVRRELAARGHSASEARSREEIGPERGTVTVEVIPGPKLRVDGWEFPGAGSFPEKRLLAAARSATGPTLRSPLLTPSFLEDAAVAVAELLRSEGWLEARAGPAQWELSEDETATTVRLPVTMGSRFVLGSLSLEGTDRWTEEEMRARSAAVTGEPVSPTRLDATVRELAALLDDEGHPDATARWSWRRGPGGDDETAPESLGEREVEEAQITLVVVEGRHFEIGAVTITGNFRTREDFLARTAGLQRGEPYGRDRLADARQRLARTGLFERVSVQGKAPTEGTQRDVSIRLIERDPLHLSLGGGLDDEEGPYFTLSAARLTRNGVSVGGNLRLGDVDQVAEIVSSARNFRGGSTDWLGSLGIRRSDEPGFVVERRGLSLQASRPGPLGSRINWRTRLQDLSLSQLELTEVEPDVDEGLFLELGASLSRDTRDTGLSPTRGRLISASLGLATRLEGGSTYSRLFLRHSSFHALRRGLVYGLGLRLGVGRAFEGGELPLSERFRAGGVTTLRGFARDRLGPSDPVTFEPLGGDALLLVNQELSLRLGSRFSAHGFVDAGNVFEDLDALGSLDLRFSAGVGLGIDTPIGPLRFYQAWPLDREPGERSSRFHFAVTSVF